MQKLNFFKSAAESLYHPSWSAFFEKQEKESYFGSLVDFLRSEEIKSSPFYPPKSLVFNSFKQTALTEVKVVILGQDPYHGCGQAHGLSFSVSQGVTPPPSLKNIFNELKSDLHIKGPSHGCLLSWAHQGVLLLNATLTVKASEPKSHYGQGWEVFTDRVIEEVAKQNRPIVFMLWGKSAQEKALNVLNHLNSNKHLILQTTHPSPFSARYGFLGSRHFSKANAFLEKNGVGPIDWSVK